MAIADLRKALTATKPAASAGSALPVLAGARLEACGGRLHVAASDLDFTAETTVPADVVTAGTVLVSHKLLGDILHGKGSIDLDATGDDLVATNGYVTSLQTMPVADYPRLPDAGMFVDQFPISMPRLLEVLDAASTEDSRPILTGVHFSGLRIAATDSYRLHVSHRGDVDYPNLLIPERALRVIAKATKPAGRKPWPTVTMLLPRDNSTWRVQFRCGSTVWTSRLIEGAFPDYDQLIPASFPNRVVFDRERMIEGVNQVKVLVRDTTTPVRLRLDRDAGTVTLTVTNVDLGVATAEVSAIYEGAPLTVAFNPHYLLEALTAGTSTMVSLSTTDSLKPAALEDVDGGSPTTLRLLMPVRVP